MESNIEAFVITEYNSIKTKVEFFESEIGKARLQTVTEGEAENSIIDLYPIKIGSESIYIGSTNDFISSLLFEKFKSEELIEGKDKLIQALKKLLSTQERYMKYADEDLKFFKKRIRSIRNRNFFERLAAALFGESI